LNQPTPSSNPNLTQKLNTDDLFPLSHVEPNPGVNLESTPHPSRLGLAQLCVERASAPTNPSIAAPQSHCHHIVSPKWTTIDLVVCATPPPPMAYKYSRTLPHVSISRSPPPMFLTHAGFVEVMLLPSTRANTYSSRRLAPKDPPVSLP
jgi:hypothetical protein